MRIGLELTVLQQQVEMPGIRASSSAEGQTNRSGVPTLVGDEGEMERIAPLLPKCELGLN
jgi:hypothetical protein